MTPNEQTPQSKAGSASSFAVLRRGIRESPGLRSGLRYTIAMAVAMTAGRVVVPILFQQILDRGLSGPGGFDTKLVVTQSVIAAAIIVFVYFAARLTFARMVRASEESLASLRIRTFAHIHALSMADQTAGRRGAF